MPTKIILQKFRLLNNVKKFIVYISEPNYYTYYSVIQITKNKTLNEFKK